MTGEGKNGGRTAILLVHGHMGTPRQFQRLLPLLPAGAEKVCLTLPGHDGDTAAFRASRRRQWQGAVTEAVDALRENYDNLILVGHSMGGLLLTQAAIGSPAKIRGIVALALPLGIRLTYRGMQIRLSSLRPPREGENGDVTAARSLCGVSGLTVWNSPGLLPNTLGLLALIRGTRKRLPLLRVPLLALHGREDEIVSLSALRRCCAGNPCCRWELLEGASHFRYPQGALETAADRIAGFIP